MFSIIANDDRTPPEKLVEKAFDLVEHLEPNSNYNFELLARHDDQGRYKLELTVFWPHFHYKWPSNSYTRRSSSEPLIKARRRHAAK